MKKPFSLPIADLCTLALHAPAMADQLADIKARGSLGCGVLDVFEPFGFTDPASRSVAGYDVDICHALARRLGVKAQIKPVSIEARIPSLQQGHMDLLAAGLAHTPLRAQQVDFSLGYYVSENVLAVKSSKPYAATADLAGRRVSYVKGSISENYLKAELPTATPMGYEEVPTAFTALVQGKVEAVSTSEEVLRKLFHKLGPKGGQYKVLQPAIGREVWGLGLRKGEGSLLQAVNQALQAMETEGEMQAIFDKWLGPATLYGMQRPFKVGPVDRPAGS
ncbi:MAG: transporter substrate-binding domain-containing protein [Delftia sp.]|uniref:ABC transporter substrate-binding protein n=1 Tax=Delftia TaxID=80865 RepID=UPI000309A458|nr:MULTISPECIES: ABC transporter substrate-binding protein [Delftia]MPT05916.1 transporter substrate-binding domain-containing protein [Delftia sp.]MPT50082.1 transporter substrate-binding domain-containing protein [Delftia sp.]SFB37738.1 polar amino acid transport system substrate-binding protein [Delftia tsuruhatensis]